MVSAQVTSSLFHGCGPTGVTCARVLESSRAPAGSTDLSETPSRTRKEPTRLQLGCFLSKAVPATPLPPAPRAETAQRASYVQSDVLPTDTAGNHVSAERWRPTPSTSPLRGRSVAGGCAKNTAVSDVPLATVSPDVISNSQRSPSGGAGSPPGAPPRSPRDPSSPPPYKRRHIHGDRGCSVKYITCDREF